MTDVIAIASDHAGFVLKEALKEKIIALGYQVRDLGANSEASVDYPDFGHALAQSVVSGEAKFGVAVCGSGIGICIAANRHGGARAALCTSAKLATLARQHNDANILALGARIVDQETAFACLETFLTTEFEGGRHQQRIDKLG